MRKYFFLIILTGVLVTGCCGQQTTGDPNEGGLWCWSEEKAKERIIKLEDTLKDKNDNTSTAQAESQRLSEQEGNLKTEYNIQRKRLEEMQEKVFKAEKDLKNTRQLSRAEKKEKMVAEQQLAQVKQELEKINRLSEKEIAHKKVKITALNEELEALLEIISNL